MSLFPSELDLLYRGVEPRSRVFLRELRSVTRRSQRLADVLGEVEKYGRGRVFYTVRLPGTFSPERYPAPWMEIVWDVEGGRTSVFEALQREERIMRVFRRKAQSFRRLAFRFSMDRRGIPRELQDLIWEMS